MITKPESKTAKYKFAISAIISFLIPLTIYILTLQPKIISGSTGWYALSVPGMDVFPPTGYPIYSILAKLFTLIPIGDLAYKMNLFSAIFGAASILILFLLINLLIKDDLISLAGALTFAFLIPFWNIANRIETESFNIFCITLSIYLAIRYKENTSTKNLYFFMLALGLSMTNSQINYYIMPVFLIFIIFTNPKIFRNARVVICCILFFLLPLMSYSYVLIRSIQGFGIANNSLSFIYYIFGRRPDGQIYAGSLPYKTVKEAYVVFLTYIQPFFKNFGIFLSVISLTGFIYMIKKNVRLAIFTFLFIITDVYIFIQYFDGPTVSFLIPIYLILCIYVCYFFLMIKDIVLLLIKKLEKSKNNSGSKKNYGAALIITVLLLMLILPLVLGISNYKYANNSKIDDAYIAWNKIFSEIDNNSYVFTSTPLANTGVYISLYEQSDKNIKIITNSDTRYSTDYMVKIFNEGNTIYAIGNEAVLNKKLNLSNTDLNYFIKNWGEKLSVKKMTKPKAELEISYIIDSTKHNTGDIFKLEFLINNKNIEKIKIDSLELKLPKNLEISSVERTGYIKQDPGFAQGKFIWVSNSYFVEGNNSIDLILNLKSKDSKEAKISFRITTQGIATEYLDIVINPGAK